MALDHFVTLGRSGLRVSPLCLGTMTFGTEWGFGTDPQNSVKMLDAYADRGGNFIDTANIYTKGHSEKIIGDHLKNDPAKRERLVIATKFMGNMFPGDPNGGGAGRKALIRACEASLRRLQTDHIDLYWAHFWDRDTPIDEMMATLDTLVRQGKVRYIGFSDHPAWVCASAQHLAQLNRWTPAIALQIEYSLLERTVEGELLPMASEFGLGVTPWSPLKGGILTGKYTRDKHPEKGEGRYKEDSRYLTETTYKIVDALGAIGKEVGATPAQVALAWVIARPGVTSTIIGARKLEHLDANLAALDVKLTEGQIAKLDELSKPKLNFPHDFLDGVKTAIQNGTTVNGDSRDPWPLSPEGDEDRY